MARRRPGRPISRDEYRGRIRRFERSSIVLRAGELGAALGDSRPGQDPRFPAFVTPWAISGVAKDAIVDGTDDRRGEATINDLIDLCFGYTHLKDPIVRQQPGGAGNLLVRVANEQFPYQADPFSEIARSIALFSDLHPLNAAGVGFSQEDVASILGASIEDYLGTGFLLHVAAGRNQGRFDPKWLTQRNLSAIVDVIPREEIVSIFRGHFISSSDEIRRIVREQRAHQRVDKYWKYEFNPLVGTPFVEFSDSVPVAPHPFLPIRKVGPSGIYYTGVDKWGQLFADRLGPVFETYVGQQLGIIPRVELLPEITFGNSEKSVDFFVVVGDLLLLIEAKTTRMTLAARLGLARLEEDLGRTIGKASEQISKSAHHVRSGHPSFSHLPDCPMIGVIVTLEPYWFANSRLLPLAHPEDDVPRICMSVRELEFMCASAHGGVDLNSLLKAVLEDHQKLTAEFGSVLAGLGAHRNPILDRAWERLPWKHHLPPGDVGEET